MRTTEMLNFRVYPGVIRALEMLGGPPEKRPSMRSIFEGILMGYLNHKRMECMDQLAAVTAELARMTEFYSSLLSASERGDEFAMNGLEFNKRMLEGMEANKESLERSIARYLEIQKTAFPDMAVNDEPEEE
jgi:hypothetical protein